MKKDYKFEIGDRVKVDFEGIEPVSGVVTARNTPPSGKYEYTVKQDGKVDGRDVSRLWSEDYLKKDAQVKKGAEKVEKGGK